MKLKRRSVSMEGNNGMSGGMRPTSMSSAGMLGLEMPLHHPQQQQQQQQQHQHNHMLAFPPQPLVPEHHSMRQQPSYPHYGVKRGHQQHQQQPAMSSEDEPGFGDDGGDGAKLLSPSQSPWTRMKWTDSMVRLLISVVYCVGDDGGGTAASGEGEQQVHHPSSAAGRGRKGGGGGAAASLLQKKGKWKSVSRAMMEKGFYVSPQQCEDKFNDLNKRYKRVNELLGKGTACRVVENQALLDTMDHLSPKAKEEARKLLNSKHLFFREMCAYHNAGAPTIPSSVPPDPQPCFAHPPSRVEQAAATGKGSGPVAPSTSATAAVAVDQMEHAMGADKEEDEDDDDDDVSSEDDDDDDGDDEDEYDDDGDDQDDVGNNKQHRHHYHHQQQKREDQQVDGESGGKRAKRTSQLLFPTSASPPLSLSLSSPVSATSIHQLSGELMAMSAGVGGEQQQSQMKQWLRRKETELEEQSVEYQCRAFQLERQRFKWLRFSTKKEREMERMKLQNDRLRLENERMLLLLRQKELELATSNGDQSKNNNNINANPKRPAEHHLNPNDHDQPYAAA
ncbi:uncharacterized protein [Typha latifolia]|uniref:uncharacterized protein n=1 Tax=Typha latifolia TaxID=4733 RepID=UPI003C2E4175